MRWASSQIRTSRLFRSASTKLLKYLNMLLTRGARAPATRRKVWVKELEPVACSTVRPRPGQLAQERERDDALAGARPTVTTTTSLVFARRTVDGVHDQSVGDLLLVEQDELLRRWISSAANVSSCLLGRMAGPSGSPPGRLPDAGRRCCEGKSRNSPGAAR